MGLFIVGRTTAHIRRKLQTGLRYTQVRSALYMRRPLGQFRHLPQKLHDFKIAQILARSEMPAGPRGS